MRTQFLRHITTLSLGAACLVGLTGCEEKKLAVNINLISLSRCTGDDNSAADPIGNCPGGIDVIAYAAGTAEPIQSATFFQDGSTEPGASGTMTIPLADGVYIQANCYSSKQVVLAKGVSASLALTKEDAEAEKSVTFNVVMSKVSGFGKAVAVNEDATCTALEWPGPDNEGVDGCEGGGTKTGRFGFTSTTIPADVAGAEKVLIAGGFDLPATSAISPNFTGEVPTDEAFIYDTALSRFCKLSSKMKQPRGWHGAAYIGEGKVFLHGGITRRPSGTKNETSPNGEVFELGTSSFTNVAAASPAVARAGHTVTAFKPDAASKDKIYVLIAGGFAINATTPDPGVFTDTAELFDPTSGQIRRVTAALNEARAYHTATVFAGANGAERVVIIGGRDAAKPIRATEIYSVAKPSAPTPAGGSAFVDAKADLVTGHWGHTSTFVSTKSKSSTVAGIVVVGGYKEVASGTPVENVQGSFATASNQVEVFAAATGKFLTGCTALTVPTARHTANLLATGDLLVAGGRGVNGAGRKEAMLLTVDPSKATGTSCAGVVTLTEPLLADGLSQPRYLHGMAALKDGVQLIGFGGVCFSGPGTSDCSTPQGARFVDSFIGTTPGVD
jgi:hypothetical protein